ncbi:MAG: discoidin domain-containing protein [Bacteroidales bacterium]|nr:discoidin domain-containing protein [Bacteroidales bacterium]
MKKFILFFFAMVLSTVTGFAKDVVFDVTVNPGETYKDESGTKIAGPQSITIDGVTIAESADAQWDQQYRFYKNHDLTVSSTVGAIAKIEFTCEANGDTKYGPGCFSAMEGYSYEGKIGTWVGNAEQVVFHVGTNQVRATRVVVTLAEPADPVVFSEVVDGGVYAIVNVQPLNPVKFFVLESVDGELTTQSADDLKGSTKFAQTAQYKAIELEDGRFAFQNVATGDYLAWRNHDGKGGNGNCGFNPEINEMSSWTMNDGTVFDEYRTYWFYTNWRSETTKTTGSLIVGNDGNWNGWGATECTGHTDFSNNYGFVACAGEVDFANSNVAAINQADFVEAGKWYLLKQKRNGVSPVHDEGVGATMKRAANDNVVVEGSDAADAVDYLLRFIPTENEGAYNLQFANGHYWASTMTTTEEEPGEYNVYKINGEATHIGINLFDMGSIVDNNGAGNTLAFWASGEVTELDGNNDWTVWEVEFAPKTTAAADLKELIKEVEAAYALNNVAELSENLITETSQFSSPYTEPSEGDINALIDGDCSTFWHSAWSQGNAEMHVHYLQVDLPEAVSGDVQVTLGRRKNQGSFCANDNVVLLGVEASADGENFVNVGQLPMPLVSGEWYESGVVAVEGAKVFRFFNDESNGTNQRGYWHAGEFQLNLVTTPALNVTFAEAAAAFQEALAAAKACGANATDADVAALQAAYDAYVAALTAAPADQYVLNFDKDLQQKSDDRHVTGFKLNDQQVTFPTYTTVYLDATDQVMEVTAGEELKPAIIWDGAWMHGVVYVDLDNDGSFYEEGDLVAHSPYTGNQNLATSISTFNAPTKEGVYRMRVKTDWIGDSQHMDGGGLDPAGRIGDDGTMEGNNSIWSNRGRIIDLVLKVVEASEPESFPKAGVAYKIKNVDAKLWINLIDDDTQNVTLAAAPQKIYFEAVEGGYTIKNEAGYVMGEHAKGWNIANSATPIVWTIEEAEGGYYLRNAKGLLGFDAITVGCKGFRDKGLDKHPLLSILEFDAVEPLTFEFAKNENGTITVTPSDDNRVYFYDIYSEAIRNKYYNGMNTVDCAKYDVANWLTTPDLETHKGVSTVDPKAWLTYFFGVDITPGDYQIVAVAVDGAGDNWTVAGDVAVYDFSYAVKTKAELWEQYMALLDQMKQAIIANKLDPENLKNINSPVAGKPGYKPVAAVHDLAMMYKTFSTDVWNAGSYEKYPYDIEEDMATCQQFLDEYLAAPICLPEAGKTYIIYSDPYSYGKANYSYVLGNCVPQSGKDYYGPSTIKYGDGSAITNAFVWTCEGAVPFERENEFFEKETVDIRYKFTNVENGTYLNWKGQDMWYLSGENTPYYGSLKMQVNADNNLYRWLVIDMRDGSLNQANGDCTGNTYSNWFYFEEFEPIITNWTGAEPVVEVTDATTVKVTFPEAHSVEATNFGVLAAVYDEQGDVYGVVFNDLFGDTVEFGKDCAVLRFKKISEINAELAEAAKGAAAKITAAAPGVDVAGKVVIASKSFKIDGEAIYNDVIVKEFEFLGGVVTGIDGIAIDANAKVYDLQGRRVAAPRQGLQISNGVKVVR